MIGVDRIAAILLAVERQYRTHIKQENNMLNERKLQLK